MANQFNLLVPNSDRASGDITRGLESDAYHGAPPVTGMASPSAMFGILGDMFQNIGKQGGEILKNLQFQKNSEIQNTISQRQLQFQKNVYNQNDPTKYTQELNDYKKQTIESISNNTWLDAGTKQKMLNNVELFTNSHENKINELITQGIKTNIISSVADMSGQISLMNDKQSEEIYNQNLQLLESAKQQNHISDDEYTGYKRKLDHSFDYTQLDKTYVKAMRVSMESNSVDQLIKFRNTLLASNKDGSPVNYKNISEQERLHKILSIDSSIQRVGTKVEKAIAQNQRSTVNLYSNFNHDISTIRQDKNIPDEQKGLMTNAILSVQNDFLKDPIKTIQEFFPIAENPSQYVLDSGDGVPYVSPEFSFKIQANQGISKPSVLSKEQALQYKGQLATMNPDQKKEFYNHLYNKFDRYTDYVISDLRKADISVADQLAFGIDDPAKRDELFKLDYMMKNPDEAGAVKISHFFGKDTLATKADIEDRQKKAKTAFINSPYGKYTFNYDKEQYGKMMDFAQDFAASPLYKNDKSLSKYFDHMNVIEEGNMILVTDMKPNYVKDTLNQATTNISEQIGLPKEYNNIVEWRQDGDNNFTMFLNYMGDLHKIATIGTKRDADNAKKLDLNNIQYSSNFGGLDRGKQSLITMEKTSHFNKPQAKELNVDVNKFLENDLLN